LVDSLAYCKQQKGLEIFAWCIMINHVNLMVRAIEGHLLQDILRDFKTFTTSKAILKAIIIDKSICTTNLKHFVPKTHAYD